MTVNELLAKIEQESKGEYLPIIGPAKARFLAELVGRIQPGVAVEVGMLTGYATAVIAEAMPSGGQLFGIEINRRAAEQARTNLETVGLADRVEIIQADASEALDRIDGPIEFVLLDAQKSQYLVQLKKLEPKLAVGATVVANGTAAYRRELGPYLDYLRQSPRWETGTETFGDDAMELSRLLG
jgi:predicted O-methyltransferase YrrM